MLIGDLEPSKRLDLVLEKLQSLPNKDRYQYFGKICRHIVTPSDEGEHNKNMEQLTKIIEKLKRDKYINELKYSSGPVDSFIYELTFEGEALLELEGGYSGRLQKENRDKAAAQNNERNTRYGVVGAAIFSGLLLAWDIVKFLHDKNQIVSYAALYLLLVLGYNLFRKAL